jgi:hypothetical protein
MKSTERIKLYSGQEKFIIQRQNESSRKWESGSSAAIKIAAGEIKNEIFGPRSLRESDT